MFRFLLIHFDLIPLGLINLNKEVQKDLVLKSTFFGLIDVHLSIIKNLLRMELKRKQPNVPIISHDHFLDLTLTNLTFSRLSQSRRQNLKITKRLLIKQLNRKSFNMIKIDPIELMLILPIFNTLNKTLNINQLSQFLTRIGKLNP